MKISVFLDNSSLAGKTIFEYFIQSLKNDHINVVYNSTEADVAVIWSVLWHGRMKKNQHIWNYFKAKNKPVIVLEVGCIKRNQTWKIGLNGVNRLASFGNCNSDSSRISKLGINLKPWKTSGNKIIICGQHGNSEQWNGMPLISDWMIDITRELKKYTNKKIILRPHPRFKVNPDYSKEFSNVLIMNPKQIPGTTDDFNFNEILDDAFAVVCYNSGPGIQSVMNGVPVFVDKSSLAYPVGIDINELHRIENPLYPDRTQWINDISYTEWTIDEIIRGIPWDRIKTML